MVTLKQLVDEQRWNNMTDIQIIKTFFELNDMEEEGMDLINELLKIKIEKLKRKERIIKDWLSYLPSKYLYENYDLDIADMLHILELDYLSNECELSKNRLEWARENIPNIIRPKVYFNPLVKWLDDKGIRFKGEASIEKKRFTPYI